jgi:hypothetical protein
MSVVGAQFLAGVVVVEFDPMNGVDVGVLLLVDDL